MTTTWYAAFGLVTVLSVLNALILVATMRQVGVLHQRVRPVGHGQIGGPGVGAQLAALPLEPVAGTPPLPTGAPLLSLAYVTPKCTVCDELLPVLHGFERTKPSGLTDLALITDASPASAEAYAIKHAVKLPMLRYDDLSAHFDIPGSPYVLTVRPSDSGKLVVMASGVVNTMEQLEGLVDTAMENVRALAQQGLGPAPTGAASNGAATAVPSPHSVV